MPFRCGLCHSCPPALGGRLQADPSQSAHLLGGSERLREGCPMDLRTGDFRRRPSEVQKNSILDEAGHGQAILLMTSSSYEAWGDLRGS